MLRALMIPALTIASFMPATAGKSYTPVTSAVYHPTLDHQTVPMTRVADHYTTRREEARKKHRRHQTEKRVGIGAAGGAAVGALAGRGKGALIGGAAGAGAGELYNKHEQNKDKRREGR